MCGWLSVHSDSNNNVIFKYIIVKYAVYKHLQLVHNMCYSFWKVTTNSLTFLPSRESMCSSHWTCICDFFIQQNVGSQGASNMSHLALSEHTSQTVPLRTQLPCCKKPNHLERPHEHPLVDNHSWTQLWSHPSSVTRQVSKEVCRGFQLPTGAERSHSYSVMIKLLTHRILEYSK